jgi:hypothetical protein
MSLLQGIAMDHAAFARPSREHPFASSTGKDGGIALDRALHLQPAPQPFAWQNGNQLLLLDIEEAQWLVAELAFDSDGCVYSEVRRAAFQSQREAIGVLLSRALACGESALIDTVEQLDRYMTRHYAVTLI